jgi:PHS family inorganic phosphate transporter-like MFS transporter
VWRIVVGLSLVPAFGTLYQRLTLAESTRFIASQKKEEDPIAALKKQQAAEEAKAEVVDAPEAVKKKAHFKGILSIFCCSIMQVY